jgi:hypothetical protein
VGSQIDFFVFQTQFTADMVPVKHNGVFRQAQNLGDLFVGLPFLYQVGNPDLHRRKTEKF